MALNLLTQKLFNKNKSLDGFSRGKFNFNLDINKNNVTKKCIIW